MDRREPPPLTITAAPTRAVPAGGPVTVDVTGEEPSPSRPRTRQAAALGAAFLLGVTTSQLVSDERRMGLGRAPEGRLSLVLDGTAGPDYVTDADGRLGVALSVDVRNAGPVDVVLQSAGVGELSDPGVEGRALLAGGLTRISLTRTVDCDERPETALPVGPLAVRARTPAGSREAQLSLQDDPALRFAQRLREACGDVPPEDALDLRASVLQFEGDRRARVPLGLRNASADDIELVDVRPVQGLTVEVFDAEGASLPLPLRLPAADFAVPRSPDAGQQHTRVTAVISLTDCNAMAGQLTDTERPLLELVVVSLSGGAVTTVPYGDGVRVLRRLLDTGCPTTAAAVG